MYRDVAAPVGLIWSSPFVRWQGRLSEVSSLDLAVAVAKRRLGDGGLDLADIEGMVLGLTIPQEGAFFGGPTVAARLGATSVTGATVSQACATAVACIHAAASTVSCGGGAQLVVTTDRTSNGPNLVYPRPSAPGGAPRVENLVQENFARDPWAGTSMLHAAETVAGELGATRDALDEITALRYEQYERSLGADRAFQRGYMVPVEVDAGRGPSVEVAEDEGIRPIDLQAIGKLSPTVPHGLHTAASQTHPADGTAGAVLTNQEEARAVSRGEGIVEVLGTGFARVAPSHMPQAPVPAADRALRAAGLELSQVDAITTHNPFAVNDLYFSTLTGVALESMNSFGCSLIWGHPQAPTGLRSIAELVQELQLRGGGIGLFTGCAAGDSAGAVVVRVAD